MPSPFPGMDPYLETKDLFQELHTQVIAHAQRLLQPQLRPKYIAKMQRHLPEESAWDADGLHKQRRIVIYACGESRKAVTIIELVTPSNKDEGSRAHAVYSAAFRAALESGLNWVEIDLVRGGSRWLPFKAGGARGTCYAAHAAQASPSGPQYRAHFWGLPDPLSVVPIPLLGEDEAVLDLGACFRPAYDAIGADVEVDYAGAPSPPPLSPDDLGRRPPAPARPALLTRHP